MSDLTYIYPDEPIDLDDIHNYGMQGPAFWIWLDNIVESTGLNYSSGELLTAYAPSNRAGIIRVAATQGNGKRDIDIISKIIEACKFVCLNDLSFVLSKYTTGGRDTVWMEFSLTEYPEEFTL